MRINRELIWIKYNKRCAYCGCEITIKQMQVDHIQPKICKGTDDEENLNPSCRECNNYKSHAGLELFRTYTKQMLNDKLHYLFKSKTKMQVAINFGAVKLSKWDGLFYFEKYEKGI